ncbi:2,3-bisphosphoglycerate-independent phosphoglycerate mutase [Patescibacteria group bacterium]|nr:2,3-bisphosphoglycerate-independent phosphoglycerate mutase [Patescibacteria group bacterium]MBU1663578.1 2,3-bisphosphoglycerate-independent phosphoglycerate mutase [Patescibacteria group bacterium]MBU1934043.1 2,3-bisphosphoglycerate-independent phosphoglycerate mutase [Patescibacteria group bacterium]MBU2007983.1 2,3-bisphosphoglycerate-independent phosphoglycerate mutase [Patescibacteria group bacterium]MBU2264109.1 2,3-bisphosphoglycerate-independent phosphoglycerate mutase [Patescibact
MFINKKKPIVLIILDGWGVSPAWGGNAIALADTKNMDYYWYHYPSSKLKASGPAVGLPARTHGNSEVGHLNIGAGQKIEQMSSCIFQLIEEQTFFENSCIIEAVEYAKKNNSCLHIMGLLSDGGVHSHIKHLEALLDVLSQKEAKEVFFHFFTDGRDVGSMSCLRYFKKIQDKIKKIKLGKISSVIGRFYSMDRDNRAERTEVAYNALTLGQAEQFSSVKEGVDFSYRKGITDEFISPFKIKDSFSPIKNKDSVIFFNFRPDRAKQITQAFVMQEHEFTLFKRKKIIKDIFFATFVPYKENMPIKSVFKHPEVEKPLNVILSNNNLKQFHIAESEKYAHITYFFNNGQTQPINGEEWFLVASPKVKSYDLKPEMSAIEITNKVLKRIKENKDDFFVINFANPDMVGHTGNMEAVIKAVKITDICLGEIVKEILNKDGIVLVTADHGNAEEMIVKETGEKNTNHTSNPVPFILIANNLEPNLHLKQDGSLCNIAPTVLKLFGLKKPETMEEDLI